MADPKIIRGVLHLWSETGTEGGHWALQDERFITPATKEWPHEHWSYDGLIPLENGDHLKILAPDGSVYWEGVVSLKHYPVFTEDAGGLWIHADQNGLDRQFWALPFFKGYKAELTRAKNELDKTADL